MPIFVGKEITTSIAGQRVETIICEKCGKAFYYELTRVGIGKGSAPYFIAQKSASNRAVAAAERDLSKRLDQEAELVPCPKCYWVNQDLVDRYRRRQFRRAPLLIVILVVAGFVAAPLVAAGLTEVLGYNSRVPGMTMLAIFAVGLLSPAWVLVIRRTLRNRIDPNATYPRRPTIPPGTPPALVEHRVPQTGEMQLTLAPSGEVERTVDPKWAMFRPGQVQLPPICCICLSPASTTYRSPLRVNENSEVEVPLCKSCSRQLSRRWWFYVVAVGAASVALAGGLAIAAPSIDTVGRWGLFGITAFFGALVGGVVIASRVCRPYRITVIDADRGIVQFAASNPAYTAMIVEQVRLSDGLVAR